MNKYIYILDYYNSNPLSSSYSRIIRFVLLNRNSLSEMTIKDIADKCFVSNATITRFSHYFGFENFASMKDHFSTNTISAKMQFRLDQNKMELLMDKPVSFLDLYVNKINESILDFKNTFDCETNDRLLEKINDTNDVYIFGALSQYFIFRDMQNSLMRSKKLVNIAHNYDDFERLLASANKDSLIIVVSSFGGFFAENDELMKKIFKKECCTYLITQNTETIIQKAFTEVIKLTSKNHVEIGSYPVIAWSEYLTRRYYSLYGQ